MADFKKHSWTGAAAGLTVELITILCQIKFKKKELSPEEISGRLLLASVGGFIGSTIPDIIDPPTGPNHRGLGHGVVTGAAGVYTCTKLNNKTENPYAKAFIKGTGVGAISHLALDSTTPKGIPFI